MYTQSPQLDFIDMCRKFRLSTSRHVQHTSSYNLQRLGVSPRYSSVPVSGKLSRSRSYDVRYVANLSRKRQIWREAPYLSAKGRSSLWLHSDTESWLSNRCMAAVKRLVMLGVEVTKTSTAVSLLLSSKLVNVWKHWPLPRYFYAIS